MSETYDLKALIGKLRSLRFYRDASGPEVPDCVVIAVDLEQLASAHKLTVGDLRAAADALERLSAERPVVTCLTCVHLKYREIAGEKPWSECELHIRPLGAEVLFSCSLHEPKPSEVPAMTEKCPHRRAGPRHRMSEELAQKLGVSATIPCCPDCGEVLPHDWRAHEPKPDPTPAPGYCFDQGDDPCQQD